MKPVNKDRHSFKFLNATQFLGALNDNVFKLIIVYFVINFRGIEDASTILATTGAVFVIPFLLFSSAAGVLADKISKRNILVAMKVVEVVIMTLSIFAIAFKSPFALYCLLFFMAMQSAVFGPSKYGIIPEIVESKNVSKANGVLNSLTYLAIIIGTFLASFIVDISNKNFILASIFCIIVAGAGLTTSIGIKKTTAKRSKKKINPLFLYEIYKTLVIASRKKYLFTSVLGSAFFLFIGGFTQLNTIPFAIQSLNLSEVGGGYLFLATAVGIAIGSVIAGKLSKDRVEPGLSCLSGFFFSFMFILLGIFSKFLFVVIILLVLVGIFGGLYLIPLDSFIQVASPDKKRGRIIAAANFLSFLGVLFASIFIYLLGGTLRISAAGGFVIMGLLTLIFVIFMTGRMSELFFSYITRKILLRFYRIKVTNLPSPANFIILNKGTWLDVILLFSFLPHLKIFRIGERYKTFPYMNKLFHSIQLVRQASNNKSSLKRLFAKTNDVKRRINFVCLFLDASYKNEDIEEFLKSSYGSNYPNICFLNIKTRERTKIFSFDQKA